MEAAATCRITSSTIDSRSAARQLSADPKQDWTLPHSCARDHRPRWSLAAALPAFGHVGWGRIHQPLINPTTCELDRLAWCLHYSQPGTQNESTDQKTHRGPDRTPNPKNIVTPR